MNSEIPADTKIYGSKQAYNEIQDQVVRDFSSLIAKQHHEVKTIVIVGAYWGLEMFNLLDSYPFAEIWAFEAHPRHFAELQNRFLPQSYPRVHLVNRCVADMHKKVLFHELSLPGSGSIYEYQGNKFGDDKHICETLELDAIPLRDFEELKGREIDLLWVDTQGAELDVLKGCDLSKVHSMFLEVKTSQYVKLWDKEPYEGQCFLSDLLAYTKGSHKLISIGLDNEYNNGQGNSFWVMEQYVPKLSLLICSLEARQGYLSRLKKILAPQILPLNNKVEVLLSIDKGERTIGAKRDALLKRAKGEYIAFIDDDDTVADNYVELILKAIETKPDVVGMSLLMYTDGINPQLSTHSLKYRTWWDEPDPIKPSNKRYYRNPNHLNPVKREYAVQAGFPSISMCEDRKYSADVLPFLKTEVFIDQPIYNYLVRSCKEC